MPRATSAYISPTRAPLMASSARYITSMVGPRPAESVRLAPHTPTLPRKGGGGRSQRGAEIPSAQAADLGFLRQIGVGGVGDAVALRPMPDRLEVDADDGGEVRAAGAEDAGVADIGAELDAVLDVVGDEDLARPGAHDLADAA